MSAKPLLVELFTEELPPKALTKLGNAFAESLFQHLELNDFLEIGAKKTSYASPRRLAVAISNVRDVSQPRPRPPKPLMPVSVGLDATGKPTPQLVKKLISLYNPQVDLDWVMRERVFREVENGKDMLKHREGDAAGAQLSIALEGAIERALENLPVPKVMSYQLGNGQTVQFVRPAHGLVALHGSDIVPVQALGLEAGRITHGHRFQGAPNIELMDASEYEAKLEKEGGVIASFEKRRDAIHAQLHEHAEKQSATLGELADYEALLGEVTALVEMPTVYVGKFAPEFLNVPAECLILTMKLNQKYFPLFSKAGRLTNKFLIVSNMRLDDPRNIIEGNERVVQPRLADARFFFEMDKKTKLVDRIPKLANVVYHNKLGSQGARVERVRKLAAYIATLIGADAQQADRAALLAKADLATDMVGEFPELQGTMGRYYALHDGEGKIVADAIEQHYKPRFAGDRLPDSNVALAVALADKLETLAGLFSIDQIPTGDKDPFALRRHALGVLRMLIERDLPLTVKDLIAHALKPFATTKPESADKLVEYIFDRLIGYLRDLGYTALEVDAVVSVRPPWGELPVRLAAVRAFQKLPEAASLAAANKRIGNILKKSDAAAAVIDASRLVEPAEHALHAAVVAARPVFDRFAAAADYSGALASLATLKTPVDAFFDSVMVNTEEPMLRANRLALLFDLHALMNKVADLSKLAA